MAQNEPLDTLIVTATRTAKPLAEILAQATIITRSEIDAAGLVSLTELLQRRAGVEIRATGGPGQPSSVFIRGANATHTLVLVDGQRVSSSTAGATAFENIPLDVIERIEIVKGPRSGLYGSDAIGGVIQIFTRRGRDDSSFASVGGGSDSIRNVTAGFSAAIGETTFLLSAGQQKINAPSASNAVAGSFTFNPDRDPYQNTNGKFGVSHRFSGADRLSIDVWQSKGKTNFDNGPGTTETVNQQTLTGMALKSDNQFTQDWRSHLSFGQTIDDIRTVSAFPGQFKTTQNLASWQNDLVVAGVELTAALERRAENVSSTTGYTNNSRTTDAVFVAASQKLDAITLSANVRHDRESQFGKRTTGGVTFGFQLVPAQLLYVSSASAFRAPSFNDLYFPGFSNPLLQPEKSRSTEIGWRISHRDVRFNTALFENKIDNLIAFDFVTSKPQNVQRATIHGIEMVVDATMLGIDWRAQLTAQDPKNVITDKLLRSRARTFGSIGAGQTVGAWQWRLDAVMNGFRFDSANESASSRMGGYTLVNAALRYRIDAHWLIEVVGNNLGDRVYALARGYNQSGRQLMLNIKYTSK